jgi:UDP-glucuronate 4-epimerase
MKILVTGSAGFIGYHLSTYLCERGSGSGDPVDVHGLDNINAYYDVGLKLARLENLKKNDRFTFHRIDLVDKEDISGLFKKVRFDYVVHLAAQAGVRYSLINPYAYINSNITGFMNILEACRHNPVKHLVYASSSSVYGANTKMPFSTHHNVDHPVSLYAATKKANELMATHTQVYIRSRQQDSGSLPSMVHGGVRIWRHSFSLKRFLRANPSMSSTMAI